jgi:predicted kinase
MSKLIVVRGLPGSGKSQLAKTLADTMNGVIASVDQYFMRSGQYLFKRSGVAHSYGFVQGQVDAFMQKGEPVIIADGVHQSLTDIEAYHALANKYGYELEVIMPDHEGAFDPRVCYEHSEHKVPFYIIRAIASHFQHMPEAVAI